MGHQPQFIEVEGLQHLAGEPTHEGAIHIGVYKIEQRAEQDSDECEPQYGRREPQG